MNPKANDVDLEALQVQPIEMPQHRAVLRRALLASPHWQNHPGDPLYFWKRIKSMQKRTLFTAGAAVSLLAIVLALVFTFLPQGTRPVQAAVVAQKSYQAVAGLSSEQRGALAGKLKIISPAELLQQAKAAKDLKTLSYEQFASQAPLPEAGKGPDLRSLVYLQFTDSDGATVTLGIDPATNLPELVMAASFAAGGKGAAGGIGAPADPAAGGAESGSMTISSGEGDGEGARFQWQGQGYQVEGAIQPDGSASFTVNGQPYSAPAGTTFKAGDPPEIKVEGGEVYFNGVKLSPER